MSSELGGEQPEGATNTVDLGAAVRLAFEKSLYAMLANTDMFHAHDEAGPRDLYASWDGSNWVVKVPSVDPQGETAVVKLSVKVSVAN